MYFLFKNEYRNFKPVEITIKKVERRKIEEMPIQVIIHIHVEVSQ
jgi:hypothetical protein